MSDRGVGAAGRFLREVGVIVLGVLIALFAESAWAERGERAEERQVLRRLATELREDSVALAGLATWAAEVEPSFDRARAVLAGRDTLPAPAQLAHLYVAGTIWILSSPRATWDELVQAGRLTLVEDSELRRLAVQYYDQRQNTERDATSFDEDPYRRAIISTLPDAYTFAVLTRCLRGEDLTVEEWGVAEVIVGASGRTDRCEVEPEAGAELWLERVRAKEGLDEALGERAYHFRAAADQLERTSALQSRLRERLSDLGYQAVR